MKRFLIPLLNLLVAAALLVGCKNLSPRGKAFVALADTQIAVDAAMKVYGKAYAAGKISADDRAKIHDAHFKYRVAFSAALELVEFNYSAATPDSVSTLAANLLNIIAQLKL